MSRITKHEKVDMHEKDWYVGHIEPAQEKMSRYIVEISPRMVIGVGRGRRCVFYDRIKILYTDNIQEALSAHAEYNGKRKFGHFIESSTLTESGDSVSTRIPSELPLEFSGTNSVKSWKRVGDKILIDTELDGIIEIGVFDTPRIGQRYTLAEGLNIDYPEGEPPYIYTNKGLYRGTRPENHVIERDATLSKCGVEFKRRQTELISADMIGYDNVNK